MFSKEGLARYVSRRGDSASQSGPPAGGTSAGPSPDDSGDSAMDGNCVCDKCGTAHMRAGSPIKNGDEAAHYLPGDI